MEFTENFKMSGSGLLNVIQKMIIKKIIKIFQESMRVLLNILIICFVVLQSIITNSQTVTASIESDSILIGKELTYTIEVKSEKAENIIFLILPPLFL